LSLDHVVRDIAAAIAAVDARRPIARSSRSAAVYQPGIGPHTEAKTLELAAAELRSRLPDIYASSRLSVPYPTTPRQRCDLVVPADPASFDSDDFVGRADGVAIARDALNFRSAEVDGPRRAIGGGDRGWNGAAPFSAATSPPIAVRHLFR
jgi:hypothetical protein